MLLEHPVPILPNPSTSPSSSRTISTVTGGPVQQAQANQASASGSGVAGPSRTTMTASVANGKRRPANGTPSAKRKRSSMSVTPEEGAGVSSGDATMADQQAASTKKKKANRACCHCQKAHLTCDDSRPCQRCVKRGMADTCAEGHRKKAKYLLDDDELEALKKAKAQGKNADSARSKTLDVTPAAATALPPVPAKQTNVLEPDSIFNLSFDPNYQFDSQAANMEYSMLSAILGNPSPQDDAIAIPPSPPPSTTITTFPGLVTNPGWPAVPQQLQHNSLSGSHFNLGGLSASTSPLQSTLSPTYSRHQVNALAPPTPPASDPSPASPNAMDISPDGQNPTASPQTIQRLTTLGTSKQALAIQHQRSSTVYSTTKKPFDYVDGYHYLMKYMQGRFEKNDILRIVRALAIFRPSLIAMQMPLSLEDEVFVEKSFQRSLIELEKLISFSGTPTVVWRRTGEICLVGMEFTMLTGWSREQLVGSRKFIYELFEHQSVVEYWENFASHAFESSSQSVFSHCVLMKPDGSPIPCAFCFSIRRDVFDLPNVVIGQWLPLL
ncbi:Transcriptional regulator of nonfermentable carbon utilization [Tulasnella sp. 419]|nr:Transcriptional regulator of nonfermentable carbon utilization [Tulasnella sp. 419]